MSLGSDSSVLSANENQTGEELRLLVIQKDHLLRASIKSALMHLGFSRILDVDSAREALKRLATQYVDIVITAPTLLETDGLSFLKQVRAEKRFSSLPFIFIGGEEDKEEESAYKSQSACQYLQAPFQDKTLHHAIIKVLMRQVSLKPADGGSEDEELQVEEDLEKEIAQESSCKISVPGFEKTRVLLIDEDEGRRTQLKRALEFFGFETILEAESGFSALRKIETGRADLIISEWDVSGLSGLDLLRAVRTNSLVQNLPFILMSARASKDNVLKALRLQVDDYAVRPSTLETLAEMLDRVLELNLKDREEGTTYKGIALDDEAQIEFAKSLVQNTYETHKGQGGALEKIRILLVDEDEKFRRVCGSLLRRMGFSRIYETSSGVSALKKLENGLVDIVFCDWYVANVSGVELLQNVRAVSFLRKTPFVILTEYAARENVLKALRAGVTDYVAKPCSIETLSECLARILSQPKDLGKTVDVES